MTELAPIFIYLVISPLVWQAAFMVFSASPRQRIKELTKSQIDQMEQSRSCCKLGIEEGNINDINTTLDQDYENDEVEEVSTDERPKYVPVDPKNIRGRPIDEVLGELEASIKQLKEEEVLETPEGNTLRESLSEGSATIMVVETRSSIRKRPENADLQDVVVEEGIAPDTAQRLLNQLRQRDSLLRLLKS